MKLSVSIPDDLWLAVRRDDEPSSQTVQEGLRLLERHRDALGPFPGAAGTMHDPATEETELIAAGYGPEETIGHAVEILLRDAESLRAKGYDIGFEIARDTPWADLERLPSGRALEAELAQSWIVSRESPEWASSFAEPFFRLLGEWGEATDEHGEPTGAPTLFHGMAQAIDEIRDEVRRRLDGTPGGAR